ncbi:hypothetical protein EK0264_11665 [Epidermidibacterium keratini]|uniref:Uncharacterized protein n=1 Tax=Epidermidibacterium keratini TaxID=1891644 RepID=A0A7L4YQP9_9ACTN|nr:hypothetical protein [Epidermidibacterium keratini]QHC00877.1 hypothetical protein EK0264_11665 [Epidermidibacterium keratini]
MPEGLRGRGAEKSSGAASRNIEAARRALRGSVSGRPAVSAANAPAQAPRPQRRRNDERTPAASMVGDHELFEAEDERPDVLRAKESAGPVKKAGPALGAS